MSYHSTNTADLFSPSLRNVSGATITSSILTILIVRFLARAIYRVYFHPLSKFPGPKLYAATRMPLNLATYKGQPHKFVTAAHEEYGSVVRIAPDELSFINADAWKDIYGHNTKNKTTKGSPPPKHFAIMETPMNGAPSLVVAPDADHTRMRRIFTPAFSDRALKQQEHLFLKYVNLLAEKLRDGIQSDPNRKFNMVKMYNFTTFDIMGHLTFGEPLQMLSQGKYNPWVATIFGFIKATTRANLTLHYPLLKRLLRSVTPKAFAKKELDHLNFSKDRVTKRLEKDRENEGVDLWDLVLSQPEVKGLSRLEMDSNAGLFMIAGTETTATLVSGLTALLLENPRTMEALKTEIRTKLSAPEDMTIEKCASLPYLNACIKEALRLYPPLVASRPRLTPADGSTICGHYIPPGFTVGIHQYATYISPSNFAEPLSFIPERWLGDPRFDNDKKHALQPFLVGPRDCIGKNMAYHEMRLIMAKVLSTFDLELCEESQNWRDQDVYTVWEKKPLLCTLKLAH